jgi:PAS domain S-box-containing protein
MDRLLQDIIDILPVGVWVADPTGKLIRSNRAAERIWNGCLPVGASDFAAYKGWWADTGKPVTPDEWGLARAIGRGETSLGQRIRIQCFDGAFKTILQSAAPLHDNAGRLTGAVAIHEDISELQQSEERWHRREQLLHTMFDLLPVGVWAIDARSRVTHVNPAADRIWGGYDWKNLTSMDAFKGWWVESGEPIRPRDWAIARALNEGSTSRNELLRIETFDGATRTIINWAAPIRDESGEITGAVAVNEDVSPLYRAQEQLRAAVRDREQILAIVAHDLRNPLGSIMVGASTAQDMATRLPGADKLRKRLSIVVELARNMAGLVDDLLAIGVSGKGGKSMLDLKRVPAAQLIERAFDRACPMFAEHGVTLTCDVDPDLPDVFVDATRIERVLQNLLDNALKYTEPPCTVTLSAKAQGPVVFSVANSGPALSPEQREAMFQPFWQAERDRRGAGLGLSICRGIVEAHGGSIWAEPALGQRVRVAFYLPRVPGERLATPSGTHAEEAS